MRRETGIAVFVASALLVWGCGSSQSSQRDESNLNVAPEVQGKMWQLSGHLNRLDRIMTGPDTPEQRAEVEGTLLEIERTVVELSTPSYRKAHELMEAEVDGFVDKIRHAKAAAALDPPNYYYAGKLFSACVSCHDPEGGVW